MCKFKCEDHLDELLAAMTSDEDIEENEDGKCPVSNNEDEEGSENDDNWFVEQQHDVDSIALTVTTTELFQFLAIQLVSLVNHPVLVKDAYQRVCIAEFGYRLFVNISTCQKQALCDEINKYGITIKPHTSSLAFITGRCTIGLYTFIHTLVATKITNTLMIGYGMKMPYVECLFLDHFDGPNLT